MIAEKISGFIGITRLDKPIGIYLLLWPALIALLISTEASINYSFVIIIVVGSILVRSTGCVINDIFDMEFDKKVERTKDRPLASGQLSKPCFQFRKTSAAGLFILCSFHSFLPLNKKIPKNPTNFLRINFWFKYSNCFFNE